MYGKNEETFIIQKMHTYQLKCVILKTYISNEHIYKYIYIFKVYEINIDKKKKYYSHSLLFMCDKIQVSFFLSKHEL
jgi:hypothetical protein